MAGDAADGQWRVCAASLLGLAHIRAYYYLTNRMRRVCRRPTRRRKSGGRPSRLGRQECHQLFGNIIERRRLALAPTEWFLTFDRRLTFTGTSGLHRPALASMFLPCLACKAPGFGIALLARTRGPCHAATGRCGVHDRKSTSRISVGLCGVPPSRCETKPSTPCLLVGGSSTDTPECLVPRAMPFDHAQVGPPEGLLTWK